MIKNMIYIGLDPGKAGGFAAILDGCLIDHFLMDREQILKSIRTYNKWGNRMRCCLEKVHAMPKQGSVSMFNFGEGYGWLKGVLDACEIPYQEISPQIWKKEYSLNSDKNQSIEVCRQLFPDARLVAPGHRTPSDGIAEAILMAEYARRKL